MFKIKYFLQTSLIFVNFTIELEVNFLNYFIALIGAIIIFFLVRKMNGSFSIELLKILLLENQQNF